MSLFIETPRLIIREVQAEDAEAMFAMDQDAEVHKYLGGKPYTDITQSHDNIAIIRQQYADNGIGRWAVELKESGEFIGWTGFKIMRDQPVNRHVDHYDFGYRHARKFWGQGYAFEAAQAALDYGVRELRIEDVYAMTDVNNAGSRCILEKLGFELKEIFPYDGPAFWVQGLPVTWYELKR
jgi:ribosomal-protein-alanine N-acetyltransferase